MGRINCNIAHAGGMGMFRKLFSAIGEIRKYFIARCLAMFPKVLLQLMAGYLVGRIAGVMIEQALGELPGCCAYPLPWRWVRRLPRGERKC